jgi:polygalacturonase
MRAVLACGVVAMASGAWAQDTRVVTEPKIPATCVKLDARINEMGDVLNEADEAKADTARIQEAIDGFAAKCKPGMAVELAMGANGAHGFNAFLSGPFEL